MTTDSLLYFDLFRPKSTRDATHSHPDHHSVAYQKQGRVEIRIGKEVFIVEEGGLYFYPTSNVYQHEAPDESIRDETKIFPMTA